MMKKRLISMALAVVLAFGGVSNAEAMAKSVNIAENGMESLAAEERAGAMLKAPKISLGWGGKQNKIPTLLIWFSKVKGADGYIISRSDAKNGKYKKIFESAEDDLRFSKDGKTWYQDMKPRAGKSYYYIVEAYKKIGSKKVCAASNIMRYTREKKPFGINMKKIEVNAKKKTLTIKWNAANAQKIEVLRKVDNGGYKVWKTISQGPNATAYGAKTFSYKGKDYKKGHEYSFGIRAYNVVNGKRVYSEMSKAYKVKFGEKENGAK